MTKSRLEIPVYSFLLLLFLLLGESLCSPSRQPDPTAFLDNGTTRAAILWRRMIDRDPFLASQASMFWRVASVNDPKTASQDALTARKITAQDPEGMLRKAFVYRSKRSLDSQFEALTHEYWRKFAANDPEVAARSAMYWLENPDANMYW